MAAQSCDSDHRCKATVNLIPSQKDGCRMIVR
jgi:hypothetical protein